MRALFVHDHIIYEHCDIFFSPGGLKKDVWKRYLDTLLLDELTVVSRGAKLLTEREDLVLSSVERVKFDPLYNVKGGIDYYLFSKEIKVHLRKYIEKVDVVIIRAPSTLGSYAYEICRQLNRPYITEVVGCSWDSNCNYGSILGKLRAPFSYIQNKILIKKSFATLYVTEHFLQKRYPTKASITTHASNVHIPPPQVTVLNKHLERLKNTTLSHIFKLGVLANVGVKYKGYDVAIDALHKLKARSPELKFEFLIAGGGSSKHVSSLIEQYGMEKEIKLLGPLASGSEVFDYLDDLDLYLQPSLTEGLPRSVIEAMSRGCPVLASSAGGIPELLDDKFLHKPGDANELSMAIEILLKDIQIRINGATENFNKSKEFTDDILSQRRLDFYMQAFNWVKENK
jgi:glycosyltransferase involved in cell wall biosynthesis